MNLVINRIIQNKIFVKFIKDEINEIIETIIKNTHINIDDPEKDKLVQAIVTKLNIIDIADVLNSAKIIIKKPVSVKQINGGNKTKKNKKTKKQNKTKYKHIVRGGGILNSGILNSGILNNIKDTINTKFTDVYNNSKANISKVQNDVSQNDVSQNDVSQNDVSKNEVPQGAVSKFIDARVIEPIQKKLKEQIFTTEYIQSTIDKIIDKIIDNIKNKESKLIQYIINKSIQNWIDTTFNKENTENKEKLMSLIAENIAHNYKCPPPPPPPKPLLNK